MHNTRDEEYYNMVLDLDTSNRQQEKYFRIQKDDECELLISAYTAAKILYTLYSYGIDALSDMIDSNEI